MGQAARGRRNPDQTGQSPAGVFEPSKMVGDPLGTVLGPGAEVMILIYKKILWSQSAAFEPRLVSLTDGHTVEPVRLQFYLYGG